MYAELILFTQEHAFTLILILMAIWLIYILRIQWKREALSQIRVRAVDMDQQEQTVYTRNLAQRILSLEAQVSFLLRIQQAKGDVKYKEVEGKLLRKMDLE